MVDYLGRLLLFPETNEPGSFYALRKKSNGTFVSVGLTQELIEQAEEEVGTYEVENYVEEGDVEYFTVHGTDYVLDSDAMLTPQDSGNFE